MLFRHYVSKSLPARLLVLSALILVAAIANPAVAQEDGKDQKKKKPEQTHAEAIGKKPFIHKQVPQFMFGAKGKKYQKSMTDWVLVDFEKRKADRTEALDALFEKAEAMPDGDKKSQRIKQLEDERKNIYETFKGMQFLLERKGKPSEYIKVTVDDAGKGTKIESLKLRFTFADKDITDKVITSKSERSRGLQVHRYELTTKHGDAGSFVRVDTFLLPDKKQAKSWVVRYWHVMPAKRHGTKEAAQDLAKLRKLFRI